MGGLSSCHIMWSVVDVAIIGVGFGCQTSVNQLNMKYGKLRLNMCCGHMHRIIFLDEATSHSRGVPVEQCAPRFLVFGAATFGVENHNS